MAGTLVRQINVHDAHVRTATVEVKVLSLSNKQVTLAVFRQLIEEELLDPDTFQLAGLPWGTVNYHPPDCCGGAEHFHVVWQKGTDLRRSCVPKRWPSQYGRENHLAGFNDAFKIIKRMLVLQAVLEEKPVRKKSANENAWTVSSRAGDLTIPGGWTGCWIVDEYVSQDRNVVYTTGLQKRLETDEEFQARKTRERDRHLKQIPDELASMVRRDEGPEPCLWSFAAAEQCLLNGFKDQKATKQDLEGGIKLWAKQYDALAQLDQLFIAI